MDKHFLLETFLQAYKCNHQQWHEQLIIVTHYLLLQQKYLVTDNGKVKKKNILNHKKIFFLDN
jgi:hypothetical protein